MNGKRARHIRRIARETCDSTLTSMHVRSVKVPALHATDMHGKPIIQDGKPVMLMPEHKRYTAFWPGPQSEGFHGSYRRVLRELKEGKRAGAPVVRL